MTKRFRIFKSFKWLYPGMYVKRWIGVCIFGIFLVFAGSAKLFLVHLNINKYFNIGLIIIGILFLAIGMKRIIVSIINILLPQKDSNSNLVDLVYKKRFLEKGPKIVTVGGGTGLSVLLHGLKEYTSNLTAIVTVADSGGSSGRLREQFDILPPGDIRNCLVALADTESLMQDLFQFRFNKESEFNGHNFGNLFITVMTKLTGDFERAIKESSKVLAIRGQVIPATLTSVNLGAEYTDGTSAEGEAEIPLKHKQIKRVYLKPEDPQATPEAIKAIKEADTIILGPGSLYTSILPNLLIKEIAQAIANSRALKIYICNVMTQPGETDGFTASDHLQTLIKHVHPRIVNWCIVNNAKPPTDILERYRKENSYPIIIDSQKIKKAGCRVVEDDIINALNYVRHDSEKLAKIIIGLIEQEIL
ncbi:MAG: YvcK family protein [Candidatus Omnitrophota bacterium]